MRPRNPADDAGSPPNGSDDPPSPSAEGTSSGEIGIVAHDDALPRDDRREHASLSAQFTGRDIGLSRKPADSLTNEPRTSHGLTTEYASIPTVTVPEGLLRVTQQLWHPRDFFAIFSRLGPGLGVWFSTVFTVLRCFETRGAAPGPRSCGRPFSLPGG